DDNQRLAMLPISMIKMSTEVVPPLLERVQDEQPNCLVYDGMFLWARIIAHALGIPGVALRPTYAPNAQFRAAVSPGRPLTFSDNTLGSPLDSFAQLREMYQLPFPDLASLIRGREGLNLVFLPRAFQPGGESFDEHFLFVGPSFHLERDKGHNFPL